MNKNEGEIIIRIIETSEVDNGVDKATTKPKKQTKPSKKTKVNKDSDTKTALKTSLIQHAGERIKGVVVDEFHYQLDKYYYLNDNYLGQQSKNIATNMISRGVSVGKSVAGGFVVGGPAGAAVMAVVEGIKLGQDIYHNYEKQRIKLKQMDEQLSFNRERAGFSLTAGVTGVNK